MITLAALTLPILTACSPPTSDTQFSWPQWDGPERSGISKEVAWSAAGKPDDLWRVELGLGYSTVAVAGGRVVSMGYDKESSLDSIWCLDALTGEVKWKHSYHSEIWNRAHEGGTVNTPSIDGDVVYTLNREGNLYCLELATGAVVWHNALMAEGNTNELTIPTWGFSASPLIVGERLFLNCGRILSIDKKSGAVKWRSKDYGDGYGTPIAFERDGTAVLAALNGTGAVLVSQADGSELGFATFTGKNRGIQAATPVLIGDSIFVSSGMIPSCARFALGEATLKPIWQNREMISSFSGCVKVGEHLYGFDGQILKCIDLDGAAAWSERGIGNGAVLAAGERLLVMGGTGELIVAKATAEKFDELSRVKLFEEGRFWTKPILVNGIIYCRNSKGTLVARDHREVETK